MHRHGPEEHSHGTAAVLSQESAAILCRGVSELLRITQGLEFRPLPSQKHPLPLACVAYPAAAERGEPVNLRGYLHPFGLRTEINLTPYVQPGRANRIELWPFATIPRNERPKGNPADMEVQNIQIGCTADP